MNTPSHFLVAAAIGRAWRRGPMVKSAFLLGSVAPDVPLLLLSLGGFAYYRLHLEWDRAEVFQKMYGELFFRDAFWIASHNLFQAPLLLVAGIALAWALRRRLPRASPWWGWFLASCLLHAVIDILTHHDDGPLLLFPFDWSTRFQSPVSYWDHTRFASEFQRFELMLDAFLLAYLAASWWRGRSRARPQG